MESLLSSNSSSDIWFTTLGMVVLDELEFPSRALTDVLGGSGTYSTLGARLFRPCELSSSIGWLIRVGNDFPKATKAKLENWKCSLFILADEGKLSTRGRLSYKDELGIKTFQYLTPMMEILPTHLSSTPLLASRSFHLLSSPEELISQVTSLMGLRREAAIEHRPLIVWEPRPPSCHSANLEAILRAVKLVDIFSPNHIEFAQVFGIPQPEILDRDLVEKYTLLFIEAGIGPSKHGSIVLRAGEEGCMIASQKQTIKWMEPYYKPCGHEKNSKVIDPTGAGNAFLGAFAVGYLETESLALAACYGNVGASFAMEQIGIPLMATDRDGKELWNGVKPQERLHEYKA